MGEKPSSNLPDAEYHKIVRELGNHTWHLANEPQREKGEWTPEDEHLEAQTSPPR